MKKIFFLLLVLSPAIGFSQGAEAQQLVLNIEKLRQFKAILKDMKSGYEIISKGYGTVKNISEGNFKLHQEFLDGLLRVSPSVLNYKKVGQIIDCQAGLVKEYKRAFERFRSDENFTSDELRYIERVYGRLLQESLRNLEDLAQIITSGKLRMTDDERIQHIDRIHEDIVDKLSFLRNFNNRTAILSINRERQKRDIESAQKMYGIKE